MGLPFNPWIQKNPITNKALTLPPLTGGGLTLPSLSGTGTLPSLPQLGSGLSPLPRPNSPAIAGTTGTYNGQSTYFPGTMRPPTQPVVSGLPPLPGAESTISSGSITQPPKPTIYAGGLQPNDPQNQYNTATGQLNTNYKPPVPTVSQPTVQTFTSQTSAQQQSPIEYAFAMNPNTGQPAYVYAGTGGFHSPGLQKISLQEAQKAVQGGLAFNPNNINISKEQLLSGNIPGSGFMSSYKDPRTGETLTNVPLSTIQQIEGNESAVKAGTMRPVPMGQGFGYIPTGSPADLLQTDPQKYQTQYPTVPTIGQDATPTVPTVGDTTKTSTTGTDTQVDAAKTQLSDLEAKVASGLELSPEEIETQKKLDALIASYQLGSADISDQPIAMPFITGQQASLERRAQAQAVPLQQRLALEQAKRQASLEMSKFQLSREDERAKAAREAEKPIEVDGQLVTRDATGVYKSVFGTPKVVKEEKADTSVVEVGNRKVLIDNKTGATIRDLGAKSMTEAETTKALEKTEKATSAQQQASQSIATVNNLLSKDRYKAIAGLLQTGSIPFFGDRTAVAEYDQLKAQLALGARSLLKGSGAVSDYESKILNQSTSALSRLANESQMKQALKNVRGVLRTNQGESVEVLVSDPAGNVSRGFLNGKDIYEAVNDGNTVEYL